MGTYGPRPLDAKLGHPLQVAADGAPVWHPVGITIDWSVVVAAPADVTLPDGTLIKAGTKYLKWGQVLTKAGSGLWVPFSTGTPLVSETVILNQLTLEKGIVPGLTSPASDHPGVLDGGLCWKARIIANASTANLALGPTYALLEAAMPLLRYAVA